jgi:hypothetical protein
VASIRRLPSGNYQAAVLLGPGRRTTKTFATHKAAVEWAIEVEAERDRLRKEVTAKEGGVRIDYLLSELGHHITDGRLSMRQKQQLLHLASLVQAEDLPETLASRTSGVASGSIAH